VEYSVHSDPAKFVRQTFVSERISNSTLKKGAGVEKMKGLQKTSFLWYRYYLVKACARVWFEFNF